MVNPMRQRDELDEYRTDYRRVTGALVALQFVILLGLIGYIWQNHEARISRLENDFQNHKDVQAQQFGGGRMERMEAKLDQVAATVNALASDLAAEKARAQQQQRMR